MRPACSIVFALASLAGARVAFAQATVPTCYFWAAPPTYSWQSPVVRGESPFVPIVRKLLYNNMAPATALGNATDALPTQSQWDTNIWPLGNSNIVNSGAATIARFYKSRGWINDNTTCLLLQNAVTTGTFHHPSTKLFRTADNSQYVACGTPPSTSTHVYAYQPFMTGALGTTTADPLGWMTAFYGGYDALQTSVPTPLPDVARLHMDSEGNGFPSGYSATDQNDLFKLQSDCRWNSVTIPGFASGKTLAALWDDYRTGAWPWVQTPTGFNTSTFNVPLVANQSMDPTPQGFRFGPYQVNATRVCLWYSGITQQAIAQRFEDVCFAPARSIWPQVKGSNYEFSTFTPGMVQNGFFQEVSSVGTAPYFQNYIDGASSPTFPQTPTFARLQERGGWEYTGGDTWQRRIFFGNNPTNVTSKPRERWGLQTNTKRAGDFSSPVLYAVGVACSPTENRHFSRFLQRNPYRTGYPIESRWEASLRYHREMLESVIESEGGTLLPNGQRQQAPWTTLAPWITAATHNAAVLCGLTGKDCYTVSYDDSNRQLGLLKSKNIKEMLVWSADNSIYSPFATTYRQVFEPYLLSVSNNPYYAETLLTTTDAVARISDTNPRWDSAGTRSTHTYDAEDTSYCHPSWGVERLTSLTEFDTQLIPNPGNNSPAMPTGETIRVTIEAELELRSTGALPDKPMFYGQLTVYNYWVPGDNQGSTPFELSRFFVTDATRESTIENGVNIRRGWIRRTIDLPLTSATSPTINSMLQTDGSFECQLFLRAEHGTATGFTCGGSVVPTLKTKIDLFQVTRAPQTTGTYEGTYCTGSTPASAP